MEFDTHKLKKAKHKIEKLGFEMIDVDVQPNQIKVSMENNDGAGDYNNQEAYGDLGIAESLHKIAEQAGNPWTWENPAVISIFI